MRFDSHACKFDRMHTMVRHTIVSTLLLQSPLPSDKERLLIARSRIFTLAVLLEVCSGTVQAASDADINQLTSYAVMLGRAAGCGLSVTDQAGRVGTWMDRRFKSGSADQQMYLPIFMAGVRDNADRQSRGLSPDDCSTVREQFALVEWP